MLPNAVKMLVNFFLTLATNSICIRSHVNFLSNSLLVLLLNTPPVNYIIVSLSKIGNKTLTRQDLETINKRARLYAYILLILVLNRAGLGTSS